MFKVVRVSHHSAELDVAMRSADVLGGAWPLPRDDAREITSGSDSHYLVLPAVAEVVEVDEAIRQRPERHGRLIALVVRPVEVGHSIADAARYELMQVRVGPTEGHLQKIVQFGKENPRRDIEDPHYGWLYLAHRDFETSRLHGRRPYGLQAAERACPRLPGPELRQWSCSGLVSGTVPVVAPAPRVRPNEGADRETEFEWHLQTRGTNLSGAS